MSAEDGLTAHEEALLVRLLEQEEDGGGAAVDEALAALPPERRALVRRLWHTLREVRESLRGGVSATTSPASAPAAVAGPERVFDAAVAGDVARDEDDARFPGFRMGRRLGAGALGVVFEAFDETLRRPVALKVLRRQTPERVLAEARRAASLEDSAVVTIHAVATSDDGRAGIVMERVDGLPLDRVAGTLPFRQRARLLARVARGLAAAHAAGVVHRDLKPENVLVTRELRPKILDFGLACSPEDRASAGGAPRGFEGTPLYASPEQARGEPAAPPSDVFSFGALAYSALVGRPPFEGGSVDEVLRAVESEEPPFPRRVDPKVPDGLQAVVLACLAKDPAQRPTAAEVAEDLLRFSRGDEVRLRPALYGDVLRRGVARQLGELDAWQEQAMVSPVEADGVRGVLRRILADEDHWILDARRLSWPQTVLHVGVWLAVVAVTLLVWRGREALSPPERWLLPAGGFVLLLVSGLGLRARDQLAASAVFLAGAVLVAAPALLAVFAELGLFAGRPEGRAQLFGPPYANDQVFVATGLAAALSAAALFLLRSTALAWTTAVLATAAYLSWRLTRGFLDAAPDARALSCLPLVLFALPGLACEAAGRVRWALPFHGVALLALVASLDVLAEHGPTTALLGLLEGEGESRHEGWSFALNGVVFLVLMAFLERSRSLDFRRGARVLELLGPFHLLVGLYGNAAAKDGPGIDVLAYLAAVVVLLGLGPWRNHRRFSHSGLLGLAFGCDLLIDRGFVDAVPFLPLVGTAGLALALLTWRLLHRSAPP